ncbi:hypothetical protein OY671_009211, partial [Metschnikowia pulcherrima]
MRVAAHVHGRDAIIRASASGVANAVAVTARLSEENSTERIAADLASPPQDRRRARRDGGVMIRSVITGSGSASPQRSVSNAESAKMVDTTDEWIVERTGIRNRYIAGEGETTSSLATDAARRASEAAGVDGGAQSAGDVDIRKAPYQADVVALVDFDAIAAAILGGLAGGFRRCEG